jgi:hypothetical protein
VNTQVCAYFSVCVSSYEDFCPCVCQVSLTVTGMRFASQWKTLYKCWVQLRTMRSPEYIVQVSGCLCVCVYAMRYEPPDRSLGPLVACWVAMPELVCIVVCLYDCLCVGQRVLEDSQSPTKISFLCSISPG